MCSEYPLEKISYFLTGTYYLKILWDFGGKVKKLPGSVFSGTPVSSHRELKVDRLGITVLRIKIP